MTREDPGTIPLEAKDARTAADAAVKAADRAADTNQPERLDDGARPVRYLWSALSSLWQAGAR